MEVTFEIYSENYRSKFYFPKFMIDLMFLGEFNKQIFQDIKNEMRLNLIKLIDNLS